MKLQDMSRIWATQDLPPLKQKLYGKKSILLCAGIVSVLGGQLFLFWLEVFSFLPLAVSSILLVSLLFLTNTSQHMKRGSPVTACMVC